MGMVRRLRGLRRCQKGRKSCQLVGCEGQLSTLRNDWPAAVTPGGGKRRARAPAGREHIRSAARWCCFIGVSVSAPYMRSSAPCNNSHTTRPVAGGRRHRRRLRRGTGGPAVATLRGAAMTTVVRVAPSARNTFPMVYLVFLVGDNTKHTHSHTHTCPVSFVLGVGSDK